MEAKFCMTCGLPLESREIDGIIRRACTGAGCSFVHWGNYSIGAGALVTRDGKILLVRRAQDPGKGYWTNPGGYVEQLEMIHDTIAREVLEEAGVEAVVTRIVAVRDQPRVVHNVYIAFAMEYSSGEPKPDGIEVDAAGFYDLEAMAEMNVAPFTRWLVDVMMRSQSAGLLPDSDPIASVGGYGFRAQ
ncbi:NUDIX domain-containing protein [Paenibacillus sp. GCM10023252]|uniref:NUDIX domain-containing protein n=1 Tax=Paenibacillus sp. GCM10023252 TaxID=3252649 RepID=UPI0036227F42